MPHPESEHGLWVQLATALRERDEALERERCSVAVLQRALAAANARADRAEAVAEGYCHNARALENGLAAARRECEALRAALNTIRRGGGGMDPLGRMEMSRIARDALAVRAAGEEK